MLLKCSIIIEHQVSWTQRQTNGQQDAAEGGHSSAVSEGKIRRCPKDVHWSKEVWEVSRDAEIPARHNVHRQLGDDAIAPSVKSRERQENL